MVLEPLRNLSRLFRRRPQPNAADQAQQLPPAQPGTSSGSQLGPHPLGVSVRLGVLPRKLTRARSESFDLIDFLLGVVIISLAAGGAHYWAIGPPAPLS